jgi:hypothetical protein
VCLKAGKTAFRHKTKGKMCGKNSPKLLPEAKKRPTGSYRRGIQEFFRSL